MKDEKREVLRRLGWWESARKVAVKDGEAADAGAMGKVVWSLQQSARALGATQPEIDRAMGKRPRRVA